MQQSLPWEIEEDILSRLPPSSLVRFKSVCKRWNFLFKEKWFTDKYLSRSSPQFIYLSNSKILSIDIINPDSDDDPTMELHELALPDDIPYEYSAISFSSISYIDGFLFCYFCLEKTQVALWNPWLREFKRIEHDDEEFAILGVGYDNTKSDKKIYKFLGYVYYDHHFEGSVFVSVLNIYVQLAIYDSESHALKLIDHTSDETFPHWDNRPQYHVSFNGNLYWIYTKPKTYELFIRCCDFSRDILKYFCSVPCQKIHCHDEFALTVKGIGFSLLKQCYITKKIEIWVTKNNKIDDDHGEQHIEWINLMTFQPTNFPDLYTSCGLSYIIYDKTLVMCTADSEAGKRTQNIYIIRRDMFKKIQIEVAESSVHCVAYAPSISRFL